MRFVVVWFRSLWRGLREYVACHARSFSQNFGGNGGKIPVERTQQVHQFCI